MGRARVRSRSSEPVHVTSCDGRPTVLGESVRVMAARFWESIGWWAWWAHTLPPAPQLPAFTDLVRATFRATSRQCEASCRVLLAALVRRGPGSILKALFELHRPRAVDSGGRRFSRRFSRAAPLPKLDIVMSPSRPRGSESFALCTPRQFCLLVCIDVSENANGWRGLCSMCVRTCVKRAPGLCPSRLSRAMLSLETRPCSVCFHKPRPLAMNYVSTWNFLLVVVRVLAFQLRDA
jgi:hypothetical protein